MMTGMNSLADQIIEAESAGGSCGVARLAGDYHDADNDTIYSADEVREACLDTRLPAEQVSRFLRDRLNIALSGQIIRRHRRGDCCR